MPLKGGAGKTTLSAHPAVQAEHERRGPVDDHGHRSPGESGRLVGWRPSRDPALRLRRGQPIATHMAELRQQHVNLVVIDAPPAMLPVIRAAILVADLVLIPMT